MSRRPQTCADCARRKIKCSKTIPCDNCQKRGVAQLCRLADVAHSVERRHPSISLSPSAPLPRVAPGESTISEKILNLVTSLSERVKELESKLDVVNPLKRSALDASLAISQGHEQAAPLQHERPTKLARILPPATHPSSTGNGMDHAAENEATADQNDFDAEAEDAATVLEFLAWGRLKDSNLTSGIRETSIIHEPAIYHEKDIFQTAQAWTSPPNSIPGGSISIETFQISQIQDMLPTKAQVFSLVGYHADWLLFMHCSFHAPSFLQELNQFYTDDEGVISMTSTGLQWTALLFAIICGSMTCAKPPQVLKWGFREDEQSVLAKRWYQASTECLNASRYQQYHSLYSVQTIASSTICAHILGFSNSQSILLASAVRIAQSLGLHRLGKPNSSPTPQPHENQTEVTQKELGRRLWQQLATQDWFSVPFSDTYCVNPLHFSTQPPSHCDEVTMGPIPLSKPSITTYGNFLFKIASFMPALQDQLSSALTLETKYEQVLRFNKMMRNLILSQLPSCLNNQTALDPSWPQHVAVARRCLTITSAHKIIMIHRSFLGLSFRDKKYEFTRRTCLAAAKTIINEMKQDLSDESPILWTTQAFSVAAAIILALDNFNKHRSVQESEEHRQLIFDALSILSKSIGISSIAARGTRLLTDLLAEEQQYFQSSNSLAPKNGKQTVADGPTRSEKSLNVAAFVKKFCESDEPPTGGSPIATSHLPLWLQQDENLQQHSITHATFEALRPSNHSTTPYLTNNRAQLASPYELGRYDLPGPSRRHDVQADPFTQSFMDAFDIKSLNWFDDLLGLAPSHSI